MGEHICSSNPRTVEKRLWPVRLKSVRPRLKILYISGYTDDMLAHHGVLESDVFLLQKPFAPDALARKLREVLDAPGARTADA